MFKGSLKRLIAMVILICLSVNILLPYSAAAQPVMNNVASVVVIAPLGSASDLPILKGIRLYKDNPFVFDFMISENKGRLSNEAFKQEADKLIKYFLAAVTVPADDLWVNLSPYEPDRIAPSAFSQSAMGGDMLAQDYILKQLSASLTNPNTQLGKNYWAAMDVSLRGAQATKQSQLGIATPSARNDNANSFQKVWITPSKAVIYEGADSVVIGETKLKVQTENDYLAQQNNYKLPDGVGAKPCFRPNDNGRLHGIAPTNTDVFRRQILPSIEQQVNTGKQFASLRQIYSAVILSTWYKNKLRQSIEQNLLKDIYVDKKKVKGVNLTDPNTKEKIYQQYLEAFKQGAYNLTKTERVGNKITRRTYFSGGATLKTTGEVIEHRDQSAMPISVVQGAREAAIVTAGAGDARLIVSGDGNKPVNNKVTAKSQASVNSQIDLALGEIAQKVGAKKLDGQYDFRAVIPMGGDFLWVDDANYLYYTKEAVLVVVSSQCSQTVFDKKRKIVYADSQANVERVPEISFNLGASQEAELKKLRIRIDIDAVIRRIGLSDANGNLFSASDSRLRMQAMLDDFFLMPSQFIAVNKMVRDCFSGLVSGGDVFNDRRRNDAVLWLSILEQLSKGSRRSACAIWQFLPEWIGCFSGTTYDWVELRACAKIIGDIQKIFSVFPGPGIEAASQVNKIIHYFSAMRNGNANFNWSDLHKIMSAVYKANLNNFGIEKLGEIMHDEKFLNGNQLRSRIMAQIKLLAKPGVKESTTVKQTDGGVSMKESDVAAVIEKRVGTMWGDEGSRIMPEFNFNLNLNNFTGLTPVILKITRASIRM